MWSIKMFGLLVLTIFLLSGCSALNSTMRMSPVNTIDANEPQTAIEFTGKAADMIAERISATLAANIQTKEGRLNELIGVLKKYFGWLFLTLLGGFIFWGFTRSRYGWVIPVVSLVGMGFIVVFTGQAEWVPYIVVAITLGLLVWKAYEYQKERNAETVKRKLGEKQK